MENNFVRTNETWKLVITYLVRPCREIQQWLPAARTYGISAKAYGTHEDSSNEAVSLCRQAACLCQGRRKKDSVQVADDCMILTQKVNNDMVLGKLHQSGDILFISFLSMQPPVKPLSPFRTCHTSVSMKWLNKHLIFGNLYSMIIMLDHSSNA